MMQSFLTEILMTAGPRKKFMSEEYGDRDLGEDVCGLIAASEKVLLWLLDGTSDLHCLIDPVSKKEYFSSRLLATGLAGKFRTYFLQTGLEDMNLAIASSIEDVKAEWLENLQALPSREQEFLRKNILAKNYPECAAPVLLAGLEINGDLTAYRCGDSKAVLFCEEDENNLKLTETSLSDKNDKSNDRIFFRLMLDDEGNFRITSNDPLYEIVQLASVKKLIAFSDGISEATQNLLKEFYVADPEGTRKKIIWQSQETGDDKSICFLEIVTTSKQQAV